MEFDIPTNLGELNDADLRALTARITAALSAAVRGGDDEVAVKATDALEAVNAESSRREALAALRSELADEVRGIVRDALTEALASDETDEVTEEEEDEVEEAEELAEVEETEEVEEEAEAPSADELAAADDAEEAPVSGPANVRYSIRVNEHARGDAVGSELELAEALHEIGRGLSDGSGRHKVVAIRTDHDIPQLTDNPMENAEILRELVGRYETADDLLASGGWAAPSQINYGFFELEGTPELVDIPTVGVNRGGLRYVDGGGPTLADVFGTDALWKWTEANDISATAGSPTKTRLQIPTDWDFAETRLDAYGVALDHGNLADRAWPELTRRFVRLALLGHRHDINDKFVAAMATASTAVDLSNATPLAPTGDGFTATLLEAIESQTERIRNKYRTDRKQVLEAVFPLWVFGAIRADLSRRNGVNMLDIPDSYALSLFTQRGVRPQFVHGWQHLSATGETWPSTVDFLLYPTGTFVKGTGGVLDLGVQRDSTLNATNDFTIIWSEEFLSLMKMGPESRKVTVGVNVKGGTAGTFTL